MVVTDFTSNLSNSFARGMVGGLLPNRYTIGSKVVTMNKLFSISINHRRLDHVKSHIMGLIASDRRSAYDFSNSERCSIETEGVFINLTFLLKEYNNSIEGIYSSHDELSPANVERLFRGNMARITNLSVRFSRYCDDYMFAKLKHRYFQFWVYREAHSAEREPSEAREARETRETREMGREIRERERSVGRNSDIPAERADLQVETTVRSSQVHQDSPGAKKRKVGGADLLFRQQDFWDSQAPLLTQDPRLAQDQLLAQGTQEPAQASVSSTQDSQPSQDHSRQTVILSLEDPPSYLTPIETPIEWEVPRVPPGSRQTTVAKLSRMQYTGKATIVHEVTARCRFVPDINIIVKPYKRTLKVSRFKLVLSSSTGDRLVAEFHDLRDVCRFFAVEEIEEIHDQMAQLTTALRQVQGSVGGVTVQVQRRVMRFGCFVRPYWTCVNDVYDLAHQTTNGLTS